MVSGAARGGRRAAKGRTVVALGLVLSLGPLVACYVAGPAYRSLHEVDGQVVQSPAPPPSAYEAYLRARLALEEQPPRLADARYFVGYALQIDPRDPHLWCTQAEIEEQAGRVEQAAASARRALALRPGYLPAQRVLARLEQDEPAGETALAGAGSRQP